MAKPQKQNNDEPTIGHNSDGEVAGSRLKSFVERIERLEEEKKELADDIKDIYAEAKGVGFDVKILRKVINRRKMTDDKRNEEDEILSLYESALQNLNSMME
jgi:uncharacterized protein (UPF0335 family)